MALFQKSMQLRLKNHYFHFFYFKYVSIPMIILNEHVHLNMIDVYQEKTGMEFRKCPNYLDIIPSEENHQEKHISQQIPQKDFLFKRSLIPQQVCSRLLSSEGVIPAPGLGQIVYRRIMHLPHSHLKGHQNFQLPLVPQAVVKDPSTGYPGSQRISPDEGTQTRQKIINDHNTFMSR